MDEVFYVLSNRIILLQDNCFVIEGQPSIRIDFLESLWQLARLGKYVTPAGSVVVEQIAGEILKIQLDYANNYILKNFELSLLQEELPNERGRNS